ncbi:MAG TPA: FAD:protein FMN transferase [Candidatus Limnocylindria bacterium]|nr:FAD:protein FMN transferase [Candidatus Limnocylindria bacterium]
MGSRLRLVSPIAEVDVAWHAVLDVFTRTDRALSRFDPDSALSRLNVAAGTGMQPVPAMLAAALSLAQRAYAVTDGVFDARIIGALESAGEQAGVDLPPSPRTLRPGEPWLQLDARRGLAALRAPVDLGGIGKGLALRWAASELRQRQVANFLLESGGDLVAAGRPSPGGWWMVALEQPGGRDPAAVIELESGALATSSVVFRRWLGPDGAWAHHLIDPRSGRPAETPLASVTIATADPAWAEVRAKVALIAARHGADPTWLIDCQGALTMMNGAAGLTAWRRADARVISPASGC